MLNYIESFEKRGHKYDQAMRRYPSARDEEFEQLFTGLVLQKGSVVADVPAGGGYLKKYLPQDCSLWEHEPCSSFRGSDEHSSLLPLPWSDESVDVAVSLAGVHHFADKQPFFRELFRVVKSGGRLILSDVAEGSPVARFLDGYVGHNNGTGHEGMFLSDGTIREIQNIGWRLLSSEQVRFHWIFDDEFAMATFAHCLFGLKDAPIRQALDAITNELGIDSLENGRLGMRWELMKVVVERP